MWVADMMKYTRFPVERKGDRVRPRIVAVHRSRVHPADHRNVVGVRHRCVFPRGWVMRSSTRYSPSDSPTGIPTNDPNGVRPWGDRPDNRNFFGGDLAGIIAHLDHIQDLGVTALYLNPIFAVAEQSQVQHHGLHADRPGVRR